MIVSRDNPETLLIAIDELGVETRFALNLGVGTDLRIPLGPASIGLRLEVSDNMHRSPVDIQVAEVEGGGSSHVDFGYVHNLRAAAGLVVPVRTLKETAMRRHTTWIALVILLGTGHSGDIRTGRGHARRGGRAPRARAPDVANRVSAGRG